MLDPELSTEDKEERKDLLKWLRKQSMQSLIDWLDCIELTTLRTDKNRISARSGDTKRDRLFFRLLGVEGYGEKHKAQLIT